MNRNFEECRKDLADTVLKSTLVLLIPTLTMSLLRVDYLGWQPFRFVQMALSVALVGLVYFRSRFSVNMKVHALIVLFICVGLSATSRLGLVSGYFIAVGGVVLASIFFSLRVAILYAVVFILAFLSIGLAISSGVLAMDIDLNMYQHQVVSWISRSLALAWLLWLLMYTFSKLRSFFIDSFTELEHKNNEFEVKNSQLLEHEIELQQQNEEYWALNEELTSRNEEIRNTNVLLKKAKRQAQESDRLKTAFLNNISHEIRTPLNGMLGFYQLLTDTTDAEKIVYYDKVIQRSSQQLLNIVDDVLEMSQLEAGEIEVSKTRYSLHNLIQEVYDVYEGLAQDKELSFAVCGGLETDLFVRVDVLKVKQVLKSLLANSFKFTDKGGVELGCRVEKRQIVFWVKDTGMGISPEAQEKIFDYFHQAEEHVSAKYGGTGLGLSISKGLVHLMNGKIWLMSERNVGSTFGFSIPLETC